MGLFLVTPKKIEPQFLLPSDGKTCRAFTWQAGDSGESWAMDVSGALWGGRGDQIGAGAAGLVEDLGGKIRWGNHGNKAVSAGHLT
jgi:hypothetical protein